MPWVEKRVPHMTNSTKALRCNNTSDNVTMLQILARTIPRWGQSETTAISQGMWKIIIACRLHDALFRLMKTGLRIRAVRYRWTLGITAKVPGISPKTCHLIGREDILCKCWRIALLMHWDTLIDCLLALKTLTWYVATTGAVLIYWITDGPFVH